MIYFTADLHFSHENIIKHCNRPFKDVEEMNETLIKNWNNIVTNRDDIYIIGDLSLKSNVADILDKLNGRKYLILGNHDNVNGKVKSKLVWVKDYYELKYEGVTFILFHYPIESWNKKHHGSIHLHGHIHNSVSIHPCNLQKNRFNVGVDICGFKPMSIGTILSIYYSSKEELCR